MKEFLTSLRTDAWRTAGGRYNAARRLKRRELVATVSLAFFSASSVALAFLQRIYVSTPGSAMDNYLTALSVCLGVFLLVISLIEWGSGNGAKADALHKNAEALNAHARKIKQKLSELDSGQQLSWIAVNELRAEYELIKVGCSENHDPLDDLLFLAQKRFSPEYLTGQKPAMSWGRSFWISMVHKWASIRSFTLYWMILIALVAYTPWFE
ncbi:MAG TPA: hypothetical protein DCY64_09835 [Hydrogenophaga sp.]|uniref:SLATT domain-containing protein n=1 Tax=Hydrogenophaga sp. TaxID=1904254 RepID=UPI0008C630A4|nr:SLATT domain-containing protein [Hydrogenophaga sp.]OGA77846.1 MAG: hypothetical protein A2X73_21475 [Burkholderiales bacterium GWE1_65_30]OGA94196.1 MAG: hypothetical protein A2X72_02095 [Burkholderiales bacterium GWF1_66_17]HAX20570.1 hypothetical protein [Hydrogenophaga sp.]